MAVILCGLTTSNKGDAYVLLDYNLQLQHEDLILNEFRIYNIWPIRWRKPGQLPGWMKNSPHYSATAEIQTFDLQHTMTTSKRSDAL